MNYQKPSPSADAVRERVHARRADRESQREAIKAAISALHAIPEDPTCMQSQALDSAIRRLHIIAQGIEYDLRHGKPFQLPDRG